MSSRSSLFGPEFVDTDALFSLSKEDYVQKKITKAIVGKFLYEEYQKLPAGADRNEIDLTKTNARAKAEMAAEIIVSGMLAQQLMHDLGDSIQAFQKFFQQYLQS